MKVLVAQSYTTLCDPLIVAHQAPLSMQEYWSGLSFPSAGDLPNPGIEPRSPALQAYSLPSEPLGKSVYVCMFVFCLQVYTYLITLNSVLLYPCIISKY